MEASSSGRLDLSSTYTIEDYTFSINAQPSGSSTNVTIYCKYKQGTESEKSNSISTSVSGTANAWSVETSETTADVYVYFGEGGYNPGVLKDAPHDSEGTTTGISGKTFLWPDRYTEESITLKINNGQLTQWIQSSSELGYDNPIWRRVLFASSSSGASMLHSDDYVVVTPNGRTEKSSENNYTVDKSFTYNNKTVYYGTMGAKTWNEVEASPIISSGIIPSPSEENIASAAWQMIYGDPDVGYGDDLVVRFDVTYDDGSGGEDPGKDKTLNLEVIGALSGRHNDPIVDPSIHYVPSDNNTQAFYGCGGNGGYGGGGGAGASTVVTYKFDTEKAENQNIVVKLKRHGYGSGGGQGGKGGDGCVLIYY